MSGSYPCALMLVYAVLINECLTYIQILLIVTFAHSTVSMFLTWFRHILHIYNMYQFLLLTHGLIDFGLMFPMVPFDVELVLGAIHFQNEGRQTWLAIEVLCGDDVLILVRETTMNMTAYSLNAGQ